MRSTFTSCMSVSMTAGSVQRNSETEVLQYLEVCVGMCLCVGVLVSCGCMSNLFFLLLGKLLNWKKS